MAELKEEAKVKKTPATETRDWPFEFTKVWPPVLLNAPYALTSYRLITPDGVANGDNSHEPAIETVFCFVSDGKAETRVTATVKYRLICTPHSGGIEEIYFEGINFDGWCPSSAGANGLVAVLAADRDSFMSKCDEPPEGLENGELYQIKQCVRHAMNGGIMESENAEIQQLMKKIIPILDLEDEDEDEAPKDKEEESGSSKATESESDDDKIEMVPKSKAESWDDL